MPGDLLRHGQEDAQEHIDSLETQLELLPEVSASRSTRRRRRAADAACTQPSPQSLAVMHC